MASTKPYLVRAIFDWCIDEELTPHILVQSSIQIQIPNHDNNKDIIFNISPASITKLVISDDFISFSARFSGIHKNVLIPFDLIKSIYALENGEGLSFATSPKTDEQEIKKNIPKITKNSHLKIVK